MFTFPTTFFTGEEETSNWLLNNLVSYYEFENNVLDSHWSNNWTDNWTSDVAWKILRWRVFDWVNDSIDFTSTIIPIWAKSISFWFKSSYIWAIQYILWNQRLTTVDDWMLVYTNTTGTIKTLIIANSVVLVNLETTSTSLLNWSYNHCVITWDWTTWTDWANIYINWTLDNSATASWTWELTASFDFTIWEDPDPTPNYWLNWDLDEPAIWNRALTQTDVTALYNSNNWLPHSSLTS